MTRLEELQKEYRELQKKMNELEEQQFIIEQEIEDETRRK